MSQWGRSAFFTIICGSLLLPPAILARGQSSQEDQAKQENAKQKAKQTKQNERKLMKELATPYKKWLQEDVAYIITDEERKAFLQLQTNEEREQFIEAFWQRRNPNPDSVENEFKEEHYRRIAYANEHYASGIPGWKTDRGRIYIIWGPPDETESHPSGGAYQRPPEEGGGETSTYPFERWRYRYLPGIGTNVELEFVDPTGTGEYHLTMDPSEKDALLYVPGAGLSDMEAMGMASKTDRFTRTDGTHLPTSMGGEPASMNEFERLDLYAKIQRPPEVKFKDLEEVVTHQILRNQIKFDYRFDFLRVTDESVLVPITVQIPNRQLTFQDKDGVQVASMNLFARISTLTGRVVQTFEDVIRRDIPDSLLQQSLAGSSIYQKSVPLRPGLYRLDIVIKDVQSGNVGVVNTRLPVPRFDDSSLSSSSLILADEIAPVATKMIGLGQFVIGSTKVRPKLDNEFEADGTLGVYLQLYNLKVDEKTHKNDATIEIRILKDNQPVSDSKTTSAELQQNGDQLTIQHTIPLNRLAPGKYKLEVVATDELNKQTLTRSADFTVKPAAANKLAAENTPGR